jgi:hypothetical protein
VAGTDRKATGQCGFRHQDIKEFTFTMTKALLVSEDKCPECGGKINWKVVRGELGSSFYNGLCKKCNIIFRRGEIPDLKRGRELARRLKVKNALDKRLTQYNTDIQVGYLRAIQHCDTCGLPDNAGKYCKCTKCKCIYCREHK